MNLPKIKLGKSQRDRAKFNLTHDVNTTADFGSVLPLMCRELVPGTKMSVSVDSFVRLAPMPVPTFGRISYRTYHQFVPLTEVYEPFENLMAGLKYSGLNGSYIPDTVPNIGMSVLTKMILTRFATFSIYKGKNAQAYNPMNTGLGAGIISDATLLTTTSDINQAVETLNDDWDTSTSELLKLQADNVASALNPVSIDGADFIFTFAPSNSVNTTAYVVAFRLTKKGRNVRKILLGCGYQFSLESNSLVSMLPLFAFYKAYFDIFAPQQIKTWTDTAVYQYGTMVKNDSQLVDITNIVESYGVRTAPVTAIRNFLDDLASCYYYGDNNYFSAHITQPNLLQELVGISTTGVTGMNTSSVVQGLGHQAAVNGVINQAQLNILKRLYTWTNKNSVIGGRIAEYMKAHFGADCLDELESNYIGADTLSCQIGDVMSTSDTISGNDGAAIGEYAGKGVGYTNGDTLKFTARTFGYWITLAVVVPQAGFYQGLDPNLLHTERFKFYNPEFDALGFQISTKDIAQASSPVLSISGNAHSTVTSDSNFGYIPRYSEMKVAQNVVNGDMSRRGTKDSLFPYCLDYNLQGGDVRAMLDESSTTPKYSTVVLYNGSYNVPIGDPLWRSIGQYPEIGQFDRIFNNSGSEDPKTDLFNDIDKNPLDDNFIVHNVLNVHMFAPMKPISESFETEGESDDVMAVEKA